MRKTETDREGEREGVCVTGAYDGADIGKLFFYTFFSSCTDEYAHTYDISTKY